MRFLVDAQLPPALAHWLGEKGFAATPVRELGLREADDGSIWNFATSGGWTVLTKDEDFVARGLATPDAPAIVWLRIGNCTNRVLFAWLETAAAWNRCAPRRRRPPRRSPARTAKAVKQRTFPGSSVPKPSAWARRENNSPLRPRPILDRQPRHGAEVAVLRHDHAIAEGERNGGDLQVGHLHVASTIPESNR